MKFVPPIGLGPETVLAPAGRMLGLAAVVGCWGAHLGAAAAEPVDVSKLPPPAKQTIDFVRDIQPIFQNICWRCHGPERPKSGFRLDSREAALKGGNVGVDIVPGNSAGSPLIHYVARLVPDMEMPPEGKGDPLTPQQVGLLRAWIDQGAPWAGEAGQKQAQPEVSFTTAFGGISVDGNERAFREQFWRPNGWDGGLERFSIRQRFADGRQVLVEGRALRDDYKVSLDLSKPDLGYVRMGWEQYRKYSDSSGVYYAAFSPSIYDLNRDLHLDLGRAWVEFGLTRPHWPKLSIGYEHQYREGDKSMLSYGPVTQSTGSASLIRNTYPSAKDLEEDRHILRLDVTYDLKGFVLEDNLRFEFYDLDSRRVDALAVSAGRLVPDSVAQVGEGHQQRDLANTFRIEKKLKDWLHLSGGYLYSHLEADAFVDVHSTDSSGAISAGSLWQASEIMLQQDLHVGNLNAQFTGWNALALGAGVQAEWQRQEGFTTATLDELVDTGVPTIGLVRQPFTGWVESDLNKAAVEENVVARYVGLRHTTLFAEARLKQESWDQFENNVGTSFSAFTRDTDATSEWQEYRFGFTASPWSKLSLTSHYKYRDRRSDYDHLLDTDPYFTGEGYPAFIRWRDTRTDETETKLSWRALPWLRASLTYQLNSTDYETATDSTDAALVGPDATSGGSILAGQYNAHVFGAGATLTPWRRLYFNGTFTYQISEIFTASDLSSATAPYRGDIYSLIASATYVLNNRTDLLAAYTFSRSNYGQSHESTGLPLGLEYERHVVQAGVTHRFSKRISGRLQYAYYIYDEPTSGHYNDFTAHALFALLSFRLP